MARSRFLHPFAAPAKEQFIPIVRGEGALVWDADGKEYVDAMAALWFANVGYGRAEIVDAMAAQARRLHTYHTFDPFTLEPTEQLADRVAAIAPIDDPRVFFCQSGSEAIDSAIKLARAAHVQAGHPERQIIVTRSAGYHGTNLGGTSAQGIPANREGFGPLAPQFEQVARDDIEPMAKLFAERGGEIAAVITEPVQGAGGVYPPPDGYLASIRRLCDDHGAFMVCDEVICGFGRLGRWFGSDFYDVRPDMITFAKAITSGYMPLGGVILGDTVHLRSPPTRATCCAPGTPTAATPPPPRPDWRASTSSRRRASSTPPPSWAAASAPGWRASSTTASTPVCGARASSGRSRPWSTRTRPSSATASSTPG